MGFMFSIAQYCLGRWCLLKYWDTIPILSTVHSLQEFRGFPIIQSFSDVLHVIAISVQFLMSYEVYESVLCYMITDMLFYADVFKKNWMYLAHHVLSVTLILFAIHYGINKDTVNVILFYFEVGLLPIAIMDFMSACGLLIPMSLYLIRPIVYFSPRACIVYRTYDPEFFFVLLPLLFHNAYILYLQIRSLMKHALVWKLQQILKTMINPPIPRPQRYR
jgi:hypothetical protein